MIRKKLSMILTGVVVVISLAFGINESHKANMLIQEAIKLKEDIIELDKKIGILTDETEVLKDENSNLNLEREELKREIERLEAEYNSLYHKYQKEISPVTFNSSNLLTASNATPAKLEVALKGTGLEGLGNTYVQAEEKYGVNAIFLVALTAEESGWGNSNRARTQNNLSGYAVYSASAKGTTFSSKEESILATAKLLSEEYLNINGNYYNGTSASSVNTRYCPEDGGNWSSHITTIANQIVSKINNR